MKPDRMCQVWLMCSEAAIAAGLSPAADHLDKDGLVRFGVPSTGGNKWGIAMNPSNREQKDIPPFGIYVEWNGWPAGCCQAGGGTIAVHPQGANEQRLLRDLKRFIKQGKLPVEVG